jgi:hypothetical protein
MYKLAAFLVLFAFGSIHAQETAVPEKLNARDVFWSAKDLVSVAPNPGSAHASVARPSEKKAVATKRKPKSTPAIQHQLDPETVTANGYGAQPHLVSLTTEHLGLRYTLLQETSSGVYSEALPSTVFHSGDRVRLSIMANHPGYLYIIQQGSSGAWSPIYPSRDAARDSNFVEAGRVYEIPRDGAFEFNQQPGKEHVFIVLSAQPIGDLDGAIFGLQNQPAAPTSPAAPSAPPQAESGTLLEAANHVPDELIQRLASRDLIPVQEQVNTPASDSAGSAQSGEKAIYVVNSLAAKGDASRVVATMVLDHE